MIYTIGILVSQCFGCYRIYQIQLAKTKRVRRFFNMYLLFYVVKPNGRFSPTQKRMNEPLRLQRYNFYLNYANIWDDFWFFPQKQTKSTQLDRCADRTQTAMLTDRCAVRFFVVTSARPYLQANKESAESTFSSCSLYASKAIILPALCALFIVRFFAHICKHTGQIIVL